MEPSRQDSESPTSFQRNNSLSSLNICLSHKIPIIYRKIFMVKNKTKNPLIFGPTPHMMLVYSPVECPFSPCWGMGDGDAEGFSPCWGITGWRFYETACSIASLESRKCLPLWWSQPNQYSHFGLLIKNRITKLYSPLLQSFTLCPKFCVSGRKVETEDIKLWYPSPTRRYSTQ